MAMDKVESATERVHVMASPELLASSLEAEWTGPVEIKASRPALPGEPWEMAFRECAPEHMSRGETHTAHTMDKVYRGLRKAITGLTEDTAVDIVTHLQNEGILFRERA